MIYDNSHNTVVAEDVIRDKLSKCLHILESGLTLAGVEFHLPNTRGARGFVDIIARDVHGKIVLVELKRSTAQSRQAIQELIKYLALFVENHGIRRSNIRCMVVSTSWHDLYAPFAEIVQSEAFQFEGYQLEIKADGTPLEAIPVEPKPGEELHLYEPYLTHCYETAEQRDIVSESIREFIRANSAADCIIVHQDYHGDNPAVIYPFAFTVCVGSMGSGSGQNVERDDIGPEWELIESALETTPWFPRDFAAHGSFQFVATLNSGWLPVRWLRTGRWENAEIWSDDDLLQVVSGFESHNGTYLRFIATPKNIVDWKQRLEQITKLFQPDPPLCKLALAILGEFASLHTKGTVVCNAFYPEDLLLGLCSPVLRKQDDLAPEIEMILAPHQSSMERIIILRFMLCWDGETRPKDAASTIKAIYKNELAYQLASVMHEHFIYRDETLEVLGLKWKAFETTADNKDGQHVVLSEGQLVRYPLIKNSIVNLGTFLAQNWDLVCDIASIIRPSSPIVVRMRDTAFFDHSPPECCDVCGRIFSFKIYDVSIPPHGQWGFICQHCFNFHGCSVGWGVGQEYTLLDGKWYLTEGGPD